MYQNHETKAIIPALLCNGTQAEMIVSAPLTNPEPPIPDTARPTINIFDEVARAVIIEPNSKTKRKNIKTH